MSEQEKMIKTSNNLLMAGHVETPPQGKGLPIDNPKKAEKTNEGK